MTSQLYIWYVEKSKRSLEAVERSFYDAIMGKRLYFPVGEYNLFLLWCWLIPNSLFNLWGFYAKDGGVQR